MRCRYFGVYKSHKSKIQRNFPYEAGFYLPNDQRVHLGCYETEEQAAVSVDRCCIYRVWSTGGVISQNIQSMTPGDLDLFDAAEISQLAKLAIQAPVLATLQT